MVFTTLNDYIENYKNMANRESSVSYNEWLYDNELIDDNDILNVNLDYIKVLEENIIDKHSYFLDKYVYVVKLTDEQYRKYRCNTHRLSYDIFGTTALWYLILNLNEMYSESEFNVTRFKMYKPDVVQHLSEIRIVENNMLNKNRAATNKFGNALKIFFNGVEEAPADLIYDVE